MAGEAIQVLGGNGWRLWRDAKLYAIGVQATISMRHISRSFA
jgi:hypothetical protein